MEQNGGMNTPGDVPEHTNIPDGVLVVASILGDVQAYNELVRRYHPAVVRLAARLTSRDEAEDIAQDAWLLAFKALPSIDNPERFGAWLKSIARNRALRHRDQTQRRNTVFSPLDHMLLVQLEGLSAPVFDEDAEEVHVALQALPEAYALVLALRYYHDMPLTRISAFLDVPVSTVKWRLHHGRQLMRVALEKLKAHD